MKVKNGKATDVKIAYIGGGSRGWARGLMSDLALEERLSGEVSLYDIDIQAAKDNEIIGNRMNSLPESKSEWKYFAVETVKEALLGADYVVISILPGTFDEMESDVHAPEEYGIYQSVGDTVGPGGIVRAMRTIPMFQEIALNIKKYCPKAWVINYTNPMTMCTRTLYEVFPEIKAFGCCHEVFGTQEFIADVYNEATGSKIQRYDVDVNIYGINHFTWINRAKYQGIDLMPMMMEYAYEHKDGLASESLNWMNKNFCANQAVKLDLYRRYGVLGAAGDRHLAEFCPGKWYLSDPQETLDRWKIKLTTVAWRKKDLQERVALTHDIIEGRQPLKIEKTGEEGVNQMAALAGLGSYVTNVNLPNKGQIPNLPYDAVVETNAYFSGNNVTPLFAGAIPDDINHLVIRHTYNQEECVRAVLVGDYERVFKVFLNDPNVNLPVDKARELFDRMLFNTKEYLPLYDNYVEQRRKV